ncbi:hypothetical protein BGZ96_004872 [Linnemannia gamsii]|uniref:RRM domain-containing protein n=1 Tax=Linnemannia gamsii TaxID=64522 RepID=A0ABQ7K6D7_9FUNG|nr:hypothetical protein BGZ96_004872 [Linnemannia gamsii]
MDATDEPYDFLNWHSNAPVVVDEKKELKKQKKAEKEAKSKTEKESKKSSKSSKKSSKKAKDSDSDSDSSEDEDEAPAAASSKKALRASKKSKTKKAPVDSDADSSSSDSDQDDPDTQPPPKSKKKKNKKKNKKKKAGAEGDDEEAEAPENESGDDDDEEGGKKKKKKKEKKEGPGRKGEYGVWIGNLSFLTTDKALRHFFRNVGAEITRINMPTGSGYNKKGNKGFAYVDFSSAEGQEAAIKLSESELDGRKVLIKSSKSFEGRPAVSKAAAQEKSMKQKHAVSPTLFVGNLSFQSTREGLQKLFEDCGEIRKVRLATFEDSGKCKGFAYIDYMAPESAVAALTDPKKHFLDGRKLNIEYASAEATLKGNPREFRKRKREEEDAAAIARGEVPPSQLEGGANYDPEAAAAVAEDEERRKHNAEQKAKRQRRQPGEAPEKKLQGHQRPGFALANAQRATTGIVEFKGNKVTF